MVLRRFGRILRRAVRLSRPHRGGSDTSPGCTSAILSRARQQAVSRLAGSAILFFVAFASIGLGAGDPASWVPARWEGGPLELSRRIKDKELAAHPATGEAISQWYAPSTLALLEPTPINCLLVSFSGGAPGEVEKRQHELIAEYARAAHARGIAVLGIVYPGAEPLAAATAAAEAKLDGLVIETGFPNAADFAGKVEGALRASGSSALVLAISSDAGAGRTDKVPLRLLEGVRPSARNLADMGIRATASAEPWIDSNIWLVRSYRSDNERRPVWISQQPNPAAPGDYVRCVADAAVGGGRWIVALDDELRAKLFRKETDALTTWREIGVYLRFAEDHAQWRSFAPYGNLALIVDSASETPEISNEYLNLVARRQVPYRLVLRSQLSAAALESFQAVLAMDVDPPSAAERGLLRGFAEKGGLVIAGPSWGDAPKDEPYAEIPLGKGRIVVYKDDPPDAGSVARDLLELLTPEVMGLSVFNLPSAIASTSVEPSGKRVLVQVLNYATAPSRRVTIRFNGTFHTARLYTPSSAPVDLKVRNTENGRTEFVIPELNAWCAIVLE